MSTEERTFQIQLEGLIQLLAQNLYAEPDVFLREMLQNAHDSIMRREAIAAERGEDDLPAKRIQVVPDPVAQSIQIIDNGSGLTRTEIDEYLSTIGRSGTDLLRQRIKEADRTRTVELIGQFGIGLLSAFIVADRVTITTKAPGHDALQWESTGGEKYTVQPAERRLVGTTVTLHLQPAHTRYLERERLQSIIRTYADFLGIAVYIGDDADPANAVVAPWHRRYNSPRDRDRAYYEFWEKKFLYENSLHVFAVDEPFEWDDISQPDGHGRGHIRGVLAITDRRLPDVNARGIVDVYISRMFISAGNREVLPQWAKFLQGVLECNELTPNAARDNVVRNAALAAVQRALGELIVRELTDLAHKDRPRFVEIMRWHSYHVLAMSVMPDNDDFFRAVADLMPLESDPEPMTVPEYLETAPVRADGSRWVYYITERGSANQYFMLANARSIRVFNCAEPFAERFLEKYKEIWPSKIHLTRLDVAGSDTIFEPLDESERAYFAELQAAYNVVFPDPRYVAKVSRFRPVDVPAVLVESRDSRSRREMEQVADNLSLPEYVRDLVKGFLKDEREPLTLQLNADNPTIRKLAERPNLRDEVSRHALASLHNNAAMLLARALRVQDVEKMFQQSNQVIELMLSLAAERSDFERRFRAGQTELDEIRRQTAGSGEGRDPYVSCFVAMPFRDPRSRKLFEAVKEVLEDWPYYWRVVRADDKVEKPGLWPDLKGKLLRAHCYIAILGREVNPNVMIEIGRMEALERTMVLIRDVEAPDLPADLTGLLYSQLDPDAADLIDDTRNELGRHEAFKALTGERYLSRSVLVRAEIPARISEAISEHYPTWGAFLGADTNEVGRRVGTSPYMIQAAKDALQKLEQ
jgi:molecular chaperone HtpG